MPVTTNRARTEFCEAERSAVARCSSSMATAPNRPCQKWPARPIWIAWHEIEVHVIRHQSAI
jgi:hypothetical protein